MRSRTAVLERSVQMASRDGLEGLTIGALAADLRVHKSSVHALFGSKEELQLATLAAARTILIDQVIAPALSSQAGLPRLRAIGDAWFDYLAADVFAGGCFLCAASAEMDGRPGPLRDEVEAVMREWIVVLSANIEAAIAAGELRAELDPAATCLPAERARHGRQLAATTDERPVRHRARTLRLASRAGQAQSQRTLSATPIRAGDRSDSSSLHSGPRNLDVNSASGALSASRTSASGSLPGAITDHVAVRVARQPILDADAQLIGYELLFREPPAETAEVLDDRAATAAVILDGLLDVGLSGLVGGRLAYLNVSRDFLLSVRPLPLPAQHVVLELLEDQIVDDDLLQVLQELVEQDFTIALDDFRLTPETEQLLQYAQIVKVDVLEHTGHDLESLLERLTEHRPSLTLLAEKVETREEFERCRELGFKAFQGYFFARPSQVRQQRMPSLGLTALGSMAELTATDDFDELHRIITRDVGLSMRLLRYANSAYVALPRRVGSVQEGLAWLGAITVRRFALMAALASAHDVPNVLLVTALVRARMCQLLSDAGESKAGDSYFTVGLFSVADALANEPMYEVIQQLPFREDIAAALLDGDGELGQLLTEVIAYERGDFSAAADLIQRHPDIERIYREATAWADQGIAELV